MLCCVLPCRVMCIVCSFVPRQLLCGLVARLLNGSELYVLFLKELGDQGTIENDWKGAWR